MSDEGKLVGGVWLPAAETHLAEHMSAGKGHRVVEGRLTYQYRKLEAALKLCKRRRTAVDVGAHVGLWSMWLTRNFDQVQAFEPVPLHRELFIRNVWPMRGMAPADALAAGKLLRTSVEVLYPQEDLARSPVWLHGCALGSTEGVVSIQVPEQTTGNAHVYLDGRHPGTKGVAHPEREYLVPAVPLRTLDSFELEAVDLLKIDVEGLEKAVVLGGEATIRRCKPVIVVEQKGNDVAYGDAPQAALRLLQKWGARIDQVLAGDYLLRWDGCGCGNRRETLKRAVGLAP